MADSSTGPGALREQALDLVASGVDCAGCRVRDHGCDGSARPAAPDRLVATTVDAGHHGGVEAAPARRPGGSSSRLVAPSPRRPTF